MAVRDEGFSSEIRISLEMGFSFRVRIYFRSPLEMGSLILSIYFEIFIGMGFFFRVRIYIRISFEMYSRTSLDICDSISLEISLKVSLKVGSSFRVRN